MPTPYIIGAPDYPTKTDYRVFHDCDHTAGLTISGSSIIYDAETGHPGIFAMTTATPQFSQSRFNWGPAVSVRPFNVDELQSVAVLARVSSTTNVQSWFGIYGSNSGPTGDQNQTNSIMSYISGNALTFRVNNASTSSATTSVTIAANTWYEFRIVRNSASAVSLYVNDVLAATVTTGVPTSAVVGIGGRCMTLENPGSKVLSLDYIDFQTTSTTARY